MKFIIVRFLGHQLEYYGPFDSREAAIKYADFGWADHGSYVVTLRAPSKPDGG